MFEIKDQFYLNGEPFQVISGTVHYFRIVPEYWKDRLEKLKNMGCNTVETYIPWNFHEPKKGVFLWSGMHNVFQFIELAQELGLYVILRPSPYICAEWEFGGLPAWLLAQPGMKLRCCYEPYLQAVKDYYSVLIPKLVPYQITNGGPVIFMQIENEYGYYGDDTAYLEFLRDTMREFGVRVPFVTSDGPWGKSFEAGQLPDVLTTGNFGSKVKERFAFMESGMQKKGPLMCMEFWVGWFDPWGQKEHNHSDLNENKKDFEDLLKLGHVNIYVFIGGTNFGFMNGANYYDTLTPGVTSYDYDAVLTEDGQITEKYTALQNIIRKYKDIPQIPLSTNVIRKNYGTLALKRKTNLFSVLDKISTPVSSVYPLSMEEAGQNTGYILYKTKMKETETIDHIRLEGAADRVLAFANQNHIFTLYDKETGNDNEVKINQTGVVIDLLVENMGRVNFGTGLEEQKKGITKGICVNGHRHFGYDIYPLPLDEEQIGRIDFNCDYREGLPAFYEFTFETEEPADTFLDFEGFGKGCAFVNGFNIGRFWEIGPQKRLYIPAPLLTKGKNTIILFETEGKAADHIILSDESRLEA